MTTRALRGWSLGSPIPLWGRRENRFYECDCQYNKPYLHSLIMTFYHWSGPIETNSDLYVGGHSIHVETPAVKAPSTFPGAFNYVQFGSGRSPVGNGKDRHNGGFYTYKPEHIHNMGKWAEVDVIGVVSLYGRIVEHEYGFRADEVQIERLWVLRGMSDRVRPSSILNFLESTYRCDVTLVNTDKVDSFTAWLQKEDIRTHVWW